MDFVPNPTWQILTLCYFLHLPLPLLKWQPPFIKTKQHLSYRNICFDTRIHTHWYSEYVGLWLWRRLNKEHMHTTSLLTSSPLALTHFNSLLSGPYSIGKDTTFTLGCWHQPVPISSEPQPDTWHLRHNTCNLQMPRPTYSSLHVAASICTVTWSNISSITENNTSDAFNREIIIVNRVKRTQTMHSEPIAMNSAEKGKGGKPQYFWGRSRDFGGKKINNFS